MTPKPAFWDTSAVVPLCLNQLQTPLVLPLYKTHEMTVWWGTSVELASALARAVRSGQADTADMAIARKTVAEIASRWFVVPPSEELRTEAALLLERYDLRAADALQLAAALMWTQKRPDGRIFLTADNKLRQAAHLSGFDTTLL